MTSRRCCPRRAPKNGSWLDLLVFPAGQTQSPPRAGLARGALQATGLRRGSSVRYLTHDKRDRGSVTGWKYLPPQVSLPVNEFARLAAGGRWIRTTSPARGARRFRLARADFSVSGKSSGGDMSRSRNLDRVTRYEWFESGFLQRRVGQTIGSVVGSNFWSRPEEPNRVHWGSERRLDCIICARSWAS